MNGKQKETPDTINVWVHRKDMLHMESEEIINTKKTLSRAIALYEEANGAADVVLVTDPTFGALKVKVKDWDARVWFGTLIDGLKLEGLGDWCRDDDLAPLTRMNVVMKNFDVTYDDNTDVDFQQIIKNALDRGTTLEEYEAEPLMPLKTEGDTTIAYLKIDLKLAQNLSERKSNALPIGGGRIVKFTLPDFTPTRNETKKKKRSWGASMSKNTKLESSFRNLTTPSTTQEGV